MRLFLLWWLLLAPAWAQAGQVVHVHIDHPCTLMVRRAGQATGTVWAEQPTTHVDIRIDNFGDFDLVGHDDGFWMRWELPDEPQSLVPGTDFYVHAHHSVMWWHVLPLSGVAVLAVLGLLWRQAAALRRQRAALEFERDQLSTQHVASGLFPANGTMPPVIPPYRVKSRLGSGGMAVVYRVENERGEEFALKLPFPNLLSDAKYMQRFTREAKIGSRLRHPNLVSLLDVNDDSNPHCPYPYLVMELVDGTTLDSIFEQRGKLPTQEVLPIIRDVLAGLQVVHANGIVHRDIKPGNIMVEQGGRARLMDFGVAHKQDTAGGKLTGTEEILGTVRYMAPEQVATRPLDGRCDIYTVGVMMYELLTGSIPYGTDDVYTILGIKCTMPLPPVGATVSLDPRLSTLIDRMVAIDPQDRPASVEEVLATLSEI